MTINYNKVSYILKNFLATPMGCHVQIQVSRWIDQIIVSDVGSKNIYKSNIHVELIEH